MTTAQRKGAKEQRRREQHKLVLPLRLCVSALGGFNGHMATETEAAGLDERI